MYASARVNWPERPYRSQYWGLTQTQTWVGSFFGYDYTTAASASRAPLGTGMLQRMLGLAAAKSYKAPKPSWECILTFLLVVDNRAIPVKQSSETQPNSFVECRELTVGESDTDTNFRDTTITCNQRIPSAHWQRCLANALNNKQTVSLLRLLRSG